MGVLSTIMGVVRRKRNKSGSVRVHIIAKEGGRYRAVQTIGSSDDDDDYCDIEQSFRSDELDRRPAAGESVECKITL